MSHTLCMASKATEASVARSLGPAPTYLVIPGRRPLVHDDPLFVDVAKPMAQLPPSEIRPTWKVATMVEPFEYVSGSTSVWWFVVAELAQVACVKRSLLICSVAA